MYKFYTNKFDWMTSFVRKSGDEQKRRERRFVCLIKVESILCVSEKLVWGRCFVAEKDGSVIHLSHLRLGQYCIFGLEIGFWVRCRLSSTKQFNGHWAQLATANFRMFVSSSKLTALCNNKQFESLNSICASRRPKVLRHWIKAISAFECENLIITFRVPILLQVFFWRLPPLLFLIGPQLSSLDL